MSVADLASTAAAIVARGKGILAADESSGTIEKRFAGINVESTEENRRLYRQLLFTTEGAAEFISGVILFDETIRQSADDGRPFSEVLSSQGILSAIAGAERASLGLDRALDGDSDATADYGLYVQTLYRDYLEQRQRFYSLEGRWPHSTFWMRRYRPPQLNQVFRFTPVRM